MNTSVICAIAAVAVIGGCSSQSQNGPSPAQAASIPFVQFGNIYDWQPDGEKGIYIEDIHRQWYYATFITACRNLPFTQRIGFRTNPPFSALDKFDSVVVEGEPCYFQTLDKAAGPPGARPKPATPPA